MRTRRRAAVAVLVALCGIAIAAGSVLTWTSARGHRPSSGIRHTAISGVLHWTYQSTGLFTHSFAMVVLVAGALVIVGGVFASRLLAGLFSLVALAASGAWIGLNARHYSPVNLPYSDLRLGAWLAVGGSLIGLLSSFFMRRRTL
ncbi:MAG TPA: hypothetical protein VMU94_17130 [Streptosporangiaceae bacterium]|nr:hypothetical protein [Streptosporangiaceae bacterium]